MTVAMPETTTDQDVFTDLMNSLDKPWTIVVLDDDVSPMDYVVAVFIKHFKLEPEIAVMKMMEVHETGRSTLDVGSHDAMLAHKEAMDAYELRSTVEQPSD